MLQRVKPGESAPKRPKTQQSAGEVMASLFWDAHGVIFIDYTLRKKGKLLEYIMLHYWIDWLTKSGRNDHICRRKQSFFIMTMHQLTHRTLHRQKSMNWVSNRFRIHRILHTWPPATIICSQTSRDGCVVGVLSRTKKLNGKHKGILQGLDKSHYWKGKEKLKDR